jgi:hypothetical protein
MGAVELASSTRFWKGEYVRLHIYLHSVVLRGVQGQLSFLYNNSEKVQLWWKQSVHLYFGGYTHFEPHRIWQGCFWCAALVGGRMCMVFCTWYSRVKHRFVLSEYDVFQHLK